MFSNRKMLEVSKKLIKIITNRLLWLSFNCSGIEQKKMKQANQINSIILFSLIAISENKGIDIDDTIEVYLYAKENGLNPVDEYKKAFFD
jgi:hypothetical protein